MGKLEMKKCLTKNGLTLPELLIAAVVILIVCCGMMVIFFRGLQLSDLTSHTQIAVNAIKNELVEIENTSFGQVIATFNNQTFTDPNLNGTGAVYVDQINPDLLQVRAVFSWNESNGRPIDIEISTLIYNVDS